MIYHYCMFWSYSLVIVRQTYKPYGTVFVTFCKYSFVRFPFKHGCAAIKCSKKVNIYQILYYLCSSKVDLDKIAHIYNQSLMHLLMLKKQQEVNMTIIDRRLPMALRGKGHKTETATTQPTKLSNQLKLSLPRQDDC